MKYPTLAYFKIVHTIKIHKKYDLLYLTMAYVDKL